MTFNVRIEDLFCINVLYSLIICIKSKESLFCLILKLKEMSVDAVKQELLAKLKEEHF